MQSTAGETVPVEKSVMPDPISEIVTWVSARELFQIAMSKAVIVTPNPASGLNAMLSGPATPLPWAKPVNVPKESLQ